MSETSNQAVKFTSKLSVLCAVLSENISLFLVPTVIPYLLEFVLEDDSFDSISFYVGLQEGLFRFMGIFGAVLWSIVSDKIGRKNCLIITMSGIAISSIGHGLSNTINTLLFWRLFAGLFSGTIPIMKALISDISGDSNISQLYGYFASGYGIASIIGPLIGGIFSKPYKMFPSLFGYQFFYDYPYFVPFFINALISFAALTCILVFIPKGSRISTERIEAKVLLQNPKYLSITSTYFFHAFVQFSYRTLISLWIKAEVNIGGLGWSEAKEPGLMYFFSGFIVSIFPLFMTKRFNKLFGVGRSIIYIELFLIPLLSSIPFNNYLSGPSLWICLIINHGLILSFITMVTSFVSIGITNSVNESYAGTAFGLTQGIVSVSRTLSAPGAAEVFRRSIGNSFPFDCHLAFFIDALVALGIAFYVKIMIGETLDKKSLAIKNESLPFDLLKENEKEKEIKV